RHGAAGGCCSCRAAGKPRPAGLPDRGRHGEPRDPRVPGIAANPLPFSSSIVEAFLIDGRNLVQLTNFGRRDAFGELLSVARRRVFFRASADPLGTNPSENCQLFSVDRFGGHLRQITHFEPSEGARSEAGCALPGPPPGCDVSGLVQDPVTRTLVFY